MTSIMEKIVMEKSTALSQNERNLLSMAYKNAIGSRRMSWRAIGAIERRSNDDGIRSAAKEYKKVVEGELKQICNTVKTLLDEYLIPKADSCESKVFYYKM